SAVPEPGTWMVLILGFFAVGWAMRRRAHLRPGLTAR
ncbi:MAG: PEPxxWA-CTERM sorting domain-containing protein, partial [Proteobacteria bacterium]|nr:PEPxxWA-CTERM sorting domain-containing protein [Pseudomonadota bacterium]